MFKINFENSCDGKYKNSIDIRFTKSCDNNCSFCIEKNGCHDRIMDIERLIKSTNNTIAETGRDTILILGGEPLLYISELIKYVEAIRSNVKNIYITTSLPKTIIENQDDFIYLIDLIDGLNVSLQHYDSDINNKILNASSNHNRILLLANLCYFANIRKKIRVSINLVKGFIDDKNKLDIFINKLVFMGVTHIKINELQNSPELFVSYENITNTKLSNPFSYGCQDEINYFDMPVKIILKRACFMVEDSLEANIQSLFKCCIKAVKSDVYSAKTIVIYEDGMVSNGWITK